MKYFDTLIEDQETTISILYSEQIIRIYSSETKTIQRLIKILGQPTVKYKKSKTYWSGASWDIDFFELDKLKEVLYRDTFIDKKLKPIIKEEKKAKKVSKKTSKKVNDEKEKKVIKKNVKTDKNISEAEEKKMTSNVTKIKPKDTKKINATQINKTIKAKAKKIKSDEKFEQIQFMF